MAPRERDEERRKQRASDEANFNYDVVSQWAQDHGGERKPSRDQAYELLRLGGFTEKFLDGMLPKHLMAGLRKALRSPQVRAADGSRLAMHSVMVYDAVTGKDYRSYVSLPEMTFLEIDFVMRESEHRRDSFQDKINYLGNYAVAKFGWDARDRLIDFELLVDPTQAVDPEDWDDDGDGADPLEPEDDNP